MTISQLRFVSAPLLAYVTIVGFAWAYLASVKEVCAGTITIRYAASSDCIYEQPHNLARSRDGNYVFVPEVRRHRVVVLDAKSLEFVRAIGTNELRYPHDVSLGPDGLLYVADSGNNRVAVYAADEIDGLALTSLRGGFENPEGVLAHPNGRIYVSGEDSGSISVFARGNQLKTISGLDHPHGIGLADDGGIWVAEAGESNRLVHFDADLNRTNRTVDRKLEGPRYLSATSAGRLYVTEKDRHGVAVISKSGRVEARLGSGKAQFGNGVFNGPEGILAVPPDLWVSDTSNGRIVRYVLEWQTSDAE